MEIAFAGFSTKRMARLPGADTGAALLQAAQSAVRGVVFGLIGTAIAQAAVALVGSLIAGVPGAMLLAGITFILSLVLAGPVLGAERRPGSAGGRMELDQEAAGQRRSRADVKARVQLIEGMTFAAESGSGHAIVVDGAPDVGGRDLGPRPMELVLMGTGACSAIDVVHILRKARQAISGCVVELEAERADADPKVFTRIHFRFVVVGTGLAPTQVERAVKLSKEKYCSATAMLARTAEISTEFVIEEAGASQT